MSCCCCCCCCSGIDFKELIQTPPTIAEVNKFMAELQRCEEPSDDDHCCFVFPAALFCCPFRCLCPCFCKAPEEVSVVRKEDVATAAKASGSRSFLGNEEAVKYLSRLFKNRGSSKVRTEYMSAGLVLLSVGSVEDKLAGLYQAFAHAVGGVFNKEALEKTVKSLVKTVIDIAAKIGDYLSGAILPGGKAVKAMLAALNGAVGGYYVKKKVREMLKGDHDGDGEISADEFKNFAMRKSSVIRKALQWTQAKTAVLRGEREEDTAGELVVDGELVHALLVRAEDDADERIVFWDSRDGLASRNRSAAKGFISLAEPASLVDDDDGGDTRFAIVDRSGKRWEVEVRSGRDEFMEWFDEVGDLCSTDIDERESQDDKEGKLCSGIFCGVC